MDHADARAVLGVDDDATPDDVRRAFRRRILDHHPDRTGGGHAAATRALIEAYRLLDSDGPEPAAAVAAHPLEQLLDVGGTFELALPPDEAFLVLLDAAADLGDVTYVDPESGLLEVVRTAPDGRRSSVVLTLQGRAATGRTEVFATEEPLG